MLWSLALMAAAVTATYIDRSYDLRTQIDHLPWFLFMGTRAARDMLNAIAVSMLTVTSLAFSLMMVAVVQTANAYSPRILREFLADSTNQNVLGILVGTFLYSLIGLRSISAYHSQQIAPVLMTNGALLLAIASTGGLVRLIDNVSRSIKVEDVIRRIVWAARNEVEHDFFEPVGHACPAEVHPEQYPAHGSTSIVSHQTGYIQLIDARALFELACRHNLLVRFHKTVGDFVISNTRIMDVWGEVDDDLHEELIDAIALGPERTLLQDRRFAVRQLVDVALRALSPAVNDPTTAIDTMNAIADILARMAEEGLEVASRCDEDMKLRLIFPTYGFADLLELAFGQILYYGGDDRVVLAHVLDICSQLHEMAPDDEVEASIAHYIDSRHLEERVRQAWLPN